MPRVASYFDTPSYRRLGTTVYDENGNPIEPGHPHYDHYHSRQQETAHPHQFYITPNPVIHHNAPPPPGTHTSATKVSRKALKKTMDKIRGQLKKAYEKSHDILLHHSRGWDGEETIRLIENLKNEANGKKKSADAEWMEKHNRELADMTAYITEKKANPRSSVTNPHPGIHTRRMMHLHEQTIHVTRKELEQIASGTQQLLRSYPVGTMMQSAYPTPTRAGGSEYYIFSILRFTAREKLMCVQAIDTMLKRMNTGDRTPKQREYVELYTEISKLKKDMDEAKAARAAMPNKRKEKPRPEMPKFPDENNPPNPAHLHRG